MSKYPKVIGTKVVIGPCRLSYAHLFKPYTPPTGGVGKYQTNVLIPKSDEATIKAIKEAIETAKKEGVTSCWGGKMPSKLDISFRDGNTKDDDVYAGHWYFNAKTDKTPGVVDLRNQPITDEDEVYSGMWANVSVKFYPYKVNGNTGIAAQLHNVQKVRDDEPFGSRASAESDFGEPVDDDDDDL